MPADDLVPALFSPAAAPADPGAVTTPGDPGLDFATRVGYCERFPHHPVCVMMRRNHGDTDGHGNGRDLIGDRHGHGHGHGHHHHHHHHNHSGGHHGGNNGGGGPLS